MILAWPPKEPHEHLDYAVDFTARLVPDETIIEFSALALNGGIEVDNVVEENGVIML